MSNQIKGGRKPLSSKPQEVVFNDGLFGDTLAIPQEYKDDAAQRGMELRFVDAKTLVENGGHHKNHWTAYKRPSGNIETSQSFKFGNDPDGIVRRGTLILAERPVTTGDMHRARIKARTAAYSMNKHKEAVDSIRQTFREGRVDSRIVTGEDD